MVKSKQTQESLRDLDISELTARLQESREKYFRLQLRHATNPLKDPTVLKPARREIARIHTILTEKATKGKV